MSSDLLLAYAALSRLSNDRQLERREATFEPRARRTRLRLSRILRAVATRVLRKGPEG